MGEVMNTAQVPEEIIGIGRGPLPRIRAHEVAHPQHRRHPAPRRVRREVLRQLRPAPTRQNVTKKRIRIRARHTGRQIHQLAHRRVHPNLLNDCIFCIQNANPAIGHAEDAGQRHPGIATEPGRR
jgi:hypothetical protein